MMMARTDPLEHSRREFERFLHAPVGEDRNGQVVTVLSTLARLGLDPWEVTAELVAQGRDRACERLGLLLSNFRDVPALEGDHTSVALKLTALLPEGPPARFLASGGPASAKGGSPLGSAIWTISAIAFILIHILFATRPGSGE